LQKKPKDMNFREINTQINEFTAKGIEVAPLITELHKRIALAFSVIVFVLLGACLAMLTRRREKSINFSMAFAIIGIYYLLLLGSNALSLQGYLMAELAMWLPNLILGSIGLLLLARICAY
jgi:lipopolysaccharide export LptBFGC system permease protein LptF